MRTTTMNVQLYDESIKTLDTMQSKHNNEHRLLCDFFKVTCLIAPSSLELFIHLTLKLDEEESPTFKQ